MNRPAVVNGARRAGWTFGLAFLVGALFTLGLVFATHSGAITARRGSIHYQPVAGNGGHITEWYTGVKGFYEIRAEAECFPMPMGSGGRGKYRFGRWVFNPNAHTTAGCKNGTYIDVGGYQVAGHKKFNVVWRKGGNPV